MKIKKKDKAFALSSAFHDAHLVRQIDDKTSDDNQSYQSIEHKCPAGYVCVWVCNRCGDCSDNSDENQYRYQHADDVHFHLISTLLYRNLTESVFKYCDLKIFRGLRE